MAQNLDGFRWRSLFKRTQIISKFSNLKKNSSLRIRESSPEKNDWTSCHCTFFPQNSEFPSFCPVQSAYRTFHSSETASLKLTNDIMNIIDSGEITVLAALDMSAASRPQCNSLHTFGPSGYVISWIYSYLTNRSSFVKIDSSSSPSTTILSGMRQGSVFGPLLFLLLLSLLANAINSDESNQNNSASFINMSTTLNFI